MESASVYHGLFQIQHNEGIQFSPTCLRIPHILNQILQHYSNNELLQLSLVNKQWNYEARRVIKDRGGMDAHLDAVGPCKDVAVFASHVRQMNVVPYSGIFIYFDHHAEEPCSSEALGSSIDLILNRLPLKHFGVRSETYRECPAFLLVKTILQDYCGLLESLHICVQYNFQKFILQTIPHSTFPCLRTMKLGRFSRRLAGSETALIKTIVSRAPSLQELHLDQRVDFHTDLLEGSSAVIVLHGEIDPLHDEIHDGIIGALRLRRMGLQFSRNFSMERFNHIVPQLLQTSCTTLDSLSLDSVFAPSLMRFGIRLENVTKLTVHLNNLFELHVPHAVAADMPEVLRILQDFDFTFIFPKLSEVEIITNSNLILLPEISELVDQGNVVLPEPSPDRTVNIKHLKFMQLPVHALLLASMFPHFETLAFESPEAGPAPPYGFIWEHWTHLTGLAVQDKGVWRHNLDSLFCGLFPEEIAQLREEDEEYLKAVNIVPVMPSITCMRELRTFRLSDCGYGLYCGENNPAYVFSEVTALIAFSRNPKLTVTLQTTLKYENAWSHMKKYASIVLIE